jgi:hypothetical protein
MLRLKICVVILIYFNGNIEERGFKSLLQIPGEAKAKAMPGWLYIHTK